MMTFRRHVMEMVLSMLIPMGILALSFNLIRPALGVNVRPGMQSTGSMVAIGVALLGMTVPMMVLMAVRGHTWRHIWEMVGAMFLPMAVIIPAGRIVLPGAGIDVPLGAMLPAAFVGMTSGMIVLMLMKRDLYEHHGHAHHARA